MSHAITSDVIARIGEAGSASRTSATLSDRDLIGLLGDLSDAISLVTVVHRSLAASEIEVVGDEEVALRYALTLLRNTYSALDMVSCCSS